jgi:hypothetical protein
LHGILSMGHVAEEKYPEEGAHATVERRDWIDNAKRSGDQRGTTY